MFGELIILQNFFQEFEMFYKKHSRLDSRAARSKFLSLDDKKKKKLKQAENVKAKFVGILEAKSLQKSMKTESRKSQLKSGRNLCDSFTCSCLTPFLAQPQSERQKCVSPVWEPGSQFQRK